MDPALLTQVRQALVAKFGTLWQAALAYQGGVMSGASLLKALHKPDEQLKAWVLEHTNIQL